MEIIWSRGDQAWDPGPLSSETIVLRVKERAQPAQRRLWSKRDSVQAHRLAATWCEPRVPATLQKRAGIWGHGWGGWWGCTPALTRPRTVAEEGPSASVELDSLEAPKDAHVRAVPTRARAPSWVWGFLVAVPAHS